MRQIRTITLGLFGLTLAAWIISSVIFNHNTDSKPPVITADSDQIEVSVKDGDAGLMKGLKATDNKDGDITDRIIVGKKSRFVKEGVCKVTYLVFDEHNNVGEYTREVRYTDYEPPKFELSKPLVYGVGERIAIMDRLTAVDAIEGDISNKIKIVSGNVDKTQQGVYTIGVQASNELGDTVSAELLVNIVKNNKNAPTVNLNTYLVNLKVGDRFDPGAYLDSVTLADGSPGDTGKVAVSNQVNTSEKGTYQVLYSYASDSGMTGYASLSVVVEE